MNEPTIKIKRFLVLPASLLFLVLNACTHQNTQETHSYSHSPTFRVSTEEYNKLAVMRYMEAYSTSLRTELEAELMVADYEVIRPEFHNMSFHAAGSELADMADPVQTAIGNRRDVVDILMAEGDMVAVRYRIQGVHQGNLYGIPATGKEIDIDAGALFWMENGRITRSWFMADEAGLLRQVGQPLPAREDGRWEAGPVYLPVVTGDEHIAGLLANPQDSQPYRNKLVINAYKAKNPPDGLRPTPEEYGTGVRRGFLHLGLAASPEAAQQYPFGGAFPDREDMIATMMADGKWVMILFRLTATNTESLFGMPVQDRPVSAYEIGFMEFDGEDWAYRWFFGDDLGMLLQLGGPMDYWFQNEASTE